MRFAGTCSMYSKKAIPQLATAATYHFRSPRVRRWPYQANVMKTFESASRATVRRATGRVSIRARAVGAGRGQPAGYTGRAPAQPGVQTFAGTRLSEQYGPRAARPALSPAYATGGHMHVRHWVSAALAVGALAGPALAAQERE